MSDNEMIVGIDLGTTNSEIAALVGNQPQVLGPGNNRMLPSCVGISPGGELLVGEAARNQLLVYPEMTARSVKRKMGEDEVVKLGEKQFTPPEISALILRELESRGVIKAIYPYFFSTVGNQTAIGPAREIGKRIVEEFTAEGVDAVIQVSG